MKDFISSLESDDPVRDLEWIENGSYGAGACLELQKVLNSLNSRTNDRARVGGLLLRVLYGKPFRYWQKLPQVVQTKLNNGVDAWRKQKHNFAMDLLA